MAGIPVAAENAATQRRYVLGAGRVYFALLDTDGVARAERYLGSSPGFSLAVNSETTEVFDDDGPIAEKVIEITRQVAHTFAIQCKNVSPENLALFGAGEVVNQADVATAMDGEWFDPETDAASVVANSRDRIIVRELDRFYKLGVFPVATTAPVRPAKPAGVRAISATPGHTVVSSDKDGSTPITPANSAATNTPKINYAVDARHGRIYVPTGGAIPAGGTIYVQYTPVADAAIPRVDFKEPQQIRGAIRYIEDSANKNVPAGNYGYEFYAPLVTVTAGGEMQVKSRETPQTISLSVAVQEPTSGPSFTILQQAA